MKLPICSLIAAGSLCSALYSQPAKPAPEPPKAESSISGQVVNAATGEPLKKASVSLGRADNQQYQPWKKDVDGTGRFTFENLESGRYFLTASRDGFTRQRYGAKRPGSRAGGTIALESNQALKGLRIEMAPHGVVSGRVVDEDGEPRSDFHVSAIQTRWMGNRRRMIPFGGVATNDLGEYRLYGLPPGSYTIRATRPPEFNQSKPDLNSSRKPEDDYVPTYYPGTADPNTAAPVQIRSGGDARGIDIKMAKTRVVRLSGTVTSGVSGKPVHADLSL